MIELVETVIEAGGCVRERWVADAPIGFERLEQGWQIREWEDAVLDLHYVELVRPYRGPLELKIECQPKIRKFLAYAIRGERVSQCMRDGAVLYASLTGRWPGYAFVASLPSGAEELVEVDGVMLVVAEWALPGFVFLGG